MFLITEYVDKFQALVLRKRIPKVDQQHRRLHFSIHFNHNISKNSAGAFLPPKNVQDFSWSKLFRFKLPVVKNEGFEIGPLKKWSLNSDDVFPPKGSLDACEKLYLKIKPVLEIFSKKKVIEVQNLTRLVKSKKAL